MRFELFRYIRGDVISYLKEMFARTFAREAVTPDRNDSIRTSGVSSAGQQRSRKTSGSLTQLDLSEPSRIARTRRGKRTGRAGRPDYRVHVSYYHRQCNVTSSSSRVCPLKAAVTACYNTPIHISRIPPVATRIPRARRPNKTWMQQHEPSAANPDRAPSRSAIDPSLTIRFPPSPFSAAFRYQYAKFVPPWCND